MIGLLPVYMNVSWTTREQKIMMSGSRERKKSSHFMRDAGVVTQRWLWMFQG